MSKLSVVLFILCVLFSYAGVPAFAEEATETPGMTETLGTTDEAMDPAEAVEPSDAMETAETTDPEEALDPSEAAESGEEVIITGTEYEEVEEGKEVEEAE